MDMADAEVVAYIGRWRPSSVSPGAAASARDVITQTGPEGRERAKNLLWAAGKLADYGLGLGLEPVPGVLLHPSVAERFSRCAPGLSGAARRTLRTNLRFIGRRVVPRLYPADMPLPRERARLSLQHRDWHTGRGDTPFIEVVPRDGLPHGVRVKGQRYRRVFISDELDRLYGEYLWQLCDAGADVAVPDLDAAQVFVNLAGGTRFAPWRPDSVYALVSRLRRDLAGIVPAVWTPHWLRHSHATALLLAGVPVHVVSRRLVSPASGMGPVVRHDLGTT